jgi:2-haloacid dehalogenase
MAAWSSVTTRKIVTFDCYRTLIDFDLEGATARVAGDRIAEVGADSDLFMRDFTAMRFQAVLHGYRPYREIVSGCLEDVMLLHGVRHRPSDGDRLVEAITRFEPFPEVPDALRRLRTAYDTAILSNSDEDLIAHSMRRIGVPFDYVITSAQARAYKPRPEAFDHMLSVVGRGPEDVIHVAQGWEYDIMPTARYRGMRRVWVNRFGRAGSALYQPYEEIRDLSALPRLLGV